MAGSPLEGVGFIERVEFGRRELRQGNGLLAGGGFR
jgi:hypothetical protein